MISSRSTVGCPGNCFQLGKGNGSMLTREKRSIKRRRIPLGVIGLALLAGAIAVGFAKTQLSRDRSVGETSPRSVLTEGKPVVTATNSAPQSTAQFDVSRSVVAGGG